MKDRSFQTLPPEIWTQILLHLDPSSLLTCVALVCHEFHSIAISNRLMNDKLRKHFGVINESKYSGLSLFHATYFDQYGTDISPDIRIMYSTEKRNWLSLIKEGDSDFIENKLRRGILNIETILPLIHEYCDNCIFLWIEKNQPLRNLLFKEIVRYLSQPNTVKIELTKAASPLHYLGMLGPTRSCVEELLPALRIFNTPRDSDGNTPIFYAIERNLVDACEMLVDYGTSLDELVNNNHINSFIAAALHNKPDIIRLLHKKGIKDVDLPKFKDRTALCITCEQGNLEAAQCLLELGANPKFKHNAGFTPIYLAATKNHHSIVSLLSKCGADINTNSYNNTTPLAIALKKKHEDTIAELIESGADFAAIQNKSMLLYLACKHNRPLAAQRLLMNGVKVNDLYMGIPPLYAAVSRGHDRIILLLLEHGANPNLRANKTSPLYVAAELNHHVIIKLLIEAGAEIDIDHDDHSPLACAIRRQHEESIITLLECGAKFTHLSSQDKAYLLFLSVKNKRPDIIRLLTENDGIDANTFYGKISPLYAAISLGYEDIVDLLLELKADENLICNRVPPIFLALSLKQAEITRKLLLAGANPNAIVDTGNSKETVLLVAAANGHTDIFKKLIEYGANLALPNPHPLYAATANKHYEIADIILNYYDLDETYNKFGGLDINETAILSAIDKSFIAAAKNNDATALQLLLKHNAKFRSPVISNGDHPLYIAATRNYWEIAELLLQERWMDPNSLFDDNETALFPAAMHGSLETIQVLIKHGAELHRQASQGQSVLHEAALYGHLDVVKFLVKTDPTLLFIKTYPTIERDTRETPLEFLRRISKDEKHVSIISFLEEAQAAFQENQQNRSYYAKQ